jgi:tetratricopeptide (TPR) repeat protein
MKTNIGKVAGYLASIVLIGGCTTFQVGGEVQKGRYALRGRQPEIAAGHFSRAAELDPDYVLPLQLRVSVYTYLGRAQYEAGNFAEARRALEIALKNNPQDSTTQLYLGLTSLRQGNRDQGRRDTETGLRGIFSTIESIAAGNTDSARYWDPGKRIRSEIQNALAASSSGKLPDGDLITISEWIGKNLDEEAEKAQADEWREIQRRSRDN